MAHDAKRFTIVRCPKCQSNNYTIKFTVTTSQGYNVKDGWVEVILFSKMQLSLNYQFKCKDCGHEWESDTFFSDLVKHE